VKQVNPHWKAFFFVTDEKPFEQELQSIIGKYNDNRLNFLNVPVAYRPAVSFNALFCVSHSGPFSLARRVLQKWLLPV